MRHGCLTPQARISIAGLEQFEQTWHHLRVAGPNCAQHEDGPTRPLAVLDLGTAAMNITFSERIRQLRKGKNLTQREVADTG